MSTFQIKLVAISLMFIDHVGAYLLPELTELRIIGRLSFPLFAWLIANGYRHTSNPNRYLTRLFLFALISQVPFALVSQLANPLSSLNIFFTLWIGLVTIMLMGWFSGINLKLIVIAGGAALGWLLPVDYGTAGVLSIVAFHVSFNRPWLMFGLQLLLFGMIYSVPLAFQITREPHLLIHPIRLWQPLAAVSVAVIALYNGQKGYAMKYGFYLFYPAHLLLIYLIRQL